MLGFEQVRFLVIVGLDDRGEDSEQVDDRHNGQAHNCEFALAETRPDVSPVTPVGKRWCSRFRVSGAGIGAGCGSRHAPSST